MTPSDPKNRPKGQASDPPEREPDVQRAVTPAEELPVAPQLDPFIEARVERAVAPYKGLVSPDDLEFMREALRLTVASHPSIAPLADRLRHRKSANSGDRPRPGADVVLTGTPARKLKGEGRK